MLYKFTAKWCSSCLITSQHFHKLISEYEKYGCKIDFTEIDVDSQEKENLKLKEKFGITDQDILPILIFTNEQNIEQNRFVGEQDRKSLILAIDQFLTLQNKSSPSSNFSQSSSNFLSKLSNIFK
jgi:thiol-disulfide isomerase/thioredoxin